MNLNNPRNSFLKFLLLAYIFICSWSGSFVIFSRPLHVYVLAAAVFFFIILSFFSLKVFPKKNFFYGDIFVFLALIWLVVNTLILPNAKSLNYLLAYFFIFGCGYFFLKPMIFYNISIKSFLKVNYLGVLFVALFSLIEFGFYAIYDLNIQELLPRIKPANATYLGTMKRSYGLSDEPTNLALYFNTMGPFAFYYIWNVLRSSLVQKTIITMVLFLAILTTFSASGYVLFIMALLFVFAIKQLRELLRPTPFLRIEDGQKYYNYLASRMGILALSLALITALTFNSKVRDGFLNFLYPIYVKVSLDNTSGNNNRVDFWLESIDKISTSPLLGSGLGSFSAEGRGSLVNWYLFLAAETGIIPVALFLSFLLTTGLRMLSSRVKLRDYYLFSLIAASAHFATISTIQNPFLWIIISVFFVDYSRYSFTKELFQ